MFKELVEIKTKILRIMLNIYMYIYICSIYYTAIVQSNILHF